ncbi:MAG TPA: MarR family winged helix-turn-helix transcriptional regulator [Terriglobales bacterium]
MIKGKRPQRLRATEYEALAEFRYQLRRFLRHMEERTRERGVNPQQYQLLLALKGLPEGDSPTIGCLAKRMQLNHNSTVELVDRCQRRGLLRRGRSSNDRRQVTLSITPQGEALLCSLGSAAREEVRERGPSLVKAVHRLTRRRAIR